MRPGSPESSVVATLTTKPECEVVAWALKDLRFIGAFVAVEPLGLPADIEARFREQTHVPNEVVETEAKEFSPNDAYIDSWRTNPTFDITTADVPFVRAAATQVLDETGRSQRLMNKLSGKTKAAQQIAAALDSQVEPA